MKELAVAALLAAMTLVSCAPHESDPNGQERSGQSGTTHDHTVFICPMHPDVMRTEPGSCPICGMDLVPAEKPETSDGIVEVDPTTAQNIGVRSAPVRVSRLRRMIRTTGRFEMNERGTHAVTLKVSGWVETLHKDYEGIIVEKGEPLLELYSPQLVSAQEDFLTALRTARRLSGSPASSDAERVLEAARRRLAYWDLSAEQVGRLEEFLTPQRTLTFAVPASGEVMRKAVVTGQYVNAGERLMDIVDISSIWLIADLYEQDLGWIGEGARARIELPYLPGREYVGRVEHIYLMMDQDSRSARARIVLPAGPGSPLRPGMYANVYLEGKETVASPVVPEEAVMRTGEQSLVILALGEGRFQPREIETGVTAGGLVQVLSGLEEDDVIVTSAQFLIDSEARLQGAVRSMLQSWTP